MFYTLIANLLFDTFPNIESHYHSGNNTLTYYFESFILTVKRHSGASDVRFIDVWSKGKQLIEFRGKNNKFSQIEYEKFKKYVLNLKERYYAST